LGTYVTFKHLCDINAYDVKYVGDCISGLAFVRGTLFDPAFGGLSGRYPTGQGFTPFEDVGALERGLAYLSRCNSGWFYHSREFQQSLILHIKSYFSELGYLYLLNPFFFFADSPRAQHLLELQNLLPNLSKT
jgi:hypothetical protein